MKHDNVKFCNIYRPSSLYSPSLISHPLLSPLNFKLQISINHVLVRKHMDVNEHERLYNITLRHTLK
jgi:hypothetical protein